MYRSHYSLAKKPFQLTTDPKFLWLGEKHKEALATLKYGVIEQKGFLLVTGDVGTGKTTLINALLESIEEDTLVANITDPALDLVEFFNFVSLSFNIPKKFDSKIDFIVYFSQFLKKVYSKNKNVLLIIDEVHRLSREVLEHIRLLSNIELPEEKLINIFFVGQNEIHQTLTLPECRALRQRISLVYQIESLSEDETLAYIKHRLKVAGTEKSIFTQNAVREIYHFSNGYPRLINIICDHALLTGFARDLKKITPDIVLECAQQFNTIGETRDNRHSISHWQHHPEYRTHFATCPYLNPMAGASEAASAEQTEPRDFIPLQTENPRTHANAQSQTQVPPLPRSQSIPKPINAQKETRNHTAVASKVSSTRRLQKRKFSWSPVVSFATRMQKGLFSRASAAGPFLKRMQKILVSGVLAAASFTTLMAKKVSSRISATSLPPLFRKKRIFWTSAVSLTLIILSLTGLYQKALTTKNSPSDPSSPTLKATVSSLNGLEGQLTSPDVQIKVAESTSDHQINSISSQKTDIPKPDILAQAKTALKEENFNRAIELFEQAMALNPANASEIRIYYSKALQGQAAGIFIKDPSKAEILLSKAVEVDPSNGDAHFDLGRLYTKSKNYPKAVKAYQKAANLNRRSSDAFYNLGFIYASIEDFANAEKMFLHVVELKPSYLDKALFNLAVVQQKLGKKQQCIEHLEKALKNNPKNQRVRQYLDQLKQDNRVS